MTQHDWNIVDLKKKKYTVTVFWYIAQTNMELDVFK